MSNDTGMWAYCRVGIPSEGYSGTEQDMKTAAQAEVDGGYGLDRGDVFLVTPSGEYLVPADRSEGKGPLEWVLAPEGFAGELRAADWDLDALGHPTA